MGKNLVLLICGLIWASCFIIEAEAQSRMYIVPVAQEDFTYISYYPDPTQSDMGNSSCQGDSFGFYSGHEGMDFIIPKNTPIYAAASGTVTHKTQSCNSGLCYGKYLYINHSGNNWTLYAHLNSYAVPNNTSVKKGELIAYSGNSGTDTPHLHWEVITGGSAISGNPHNPYYCDAEWFTTNPPTYADEERNCHTETIQIYDDEPVNGAMIYTHPDGDHYQFHEYYRDGAGLVLLDRGDMGSEFAHPVIDGEGSVENKEKWVVGDVDGSGYDDMVLITEPTSSSFKAHVWLSNGDGSFQSREKWLESNHKPDLYFLADKNGDGDDDLIVAYQNGNAASQIVTWDKYPSNVWFKNGQGNWERRDRSDWQFEDREEWVYDFGININTDVYLVGDVSGNEKADIICGYERPENPSCSTGGKKMRWYAYTGGHGKEWLSTWGCISSDYMLGNVNGDNEGKMDLVQVRHDSPTKSSVFVAKSNGSGFDRTSQWKSDFCNVHHTYWMSDVNLDGDDDIFCYYRTHPLSLNMMHSNGSTEFGMKREFLRGIYRETGGAFRFGHFSDIYLAIGEEEHTVCDTVQAAGISSCYAEVEVDANSFWFHDDGYVAPGFASYEIECGSWAFLAIDGETTDLLYSSGEVIWEEDDFGNPTCNTDPSWPVCGWITTD